MANGDVIMPLVWIKVLRERCVWTFLLQIYVTPRADLDIGVNYLHLNSVVAIKRGTPWLPWSGPFCSFYCKECSILRSLSFFPVSIHYPPCTRHSHRHAHSHNTEHHFVTSCSKTRLMLKPGVKTPPSASSLPWWIVESGLHWCCLLCTFVTRV